MWLGIIVLAAGAWYYYTHNMQQQQPSNQPAGQQPGPQGQQPGPQGQQPGPQGQQPGPQGQQPGGQGQGAPDPLVQAQKFTCNAVPQNGVVEITQGAWTNGATVTVQSATLACAQSDGNGNIIQASLFQTMLNGPLGPGQSTTFNTFSIGQEQQGAEGAGCAIVAATAANQ